jgi:phenolphthiocerol/phthiocerol/phthiodiolone dimycocerosyl transferase
MEIVVTVLERPLNYLELAHLNRVVIMAAHYEGEVADDALERAFRLLCEAYPVLRAHIRGTGQDASFCVVPDYFPELLVLQDAPDVLSKIVELPWNAGEAVADLVHVRGDGRGYLALRADHSIVDANGWLGMFRELLRLLAGDDRDVVAGDALPAAPAMLFQQRLGLIPYDRRLFHTAGGASALDGSASLLSGYLTLSEMETQWLRRAARFYRTSVHGLVCGAILLAQRALAGGTEPARMYCVSPVDFRGRVDPPVGLLDTTNFMLSYVAEADVSARMSPITVGQAVKTQMDDVLSRGEGVRSSSPMTDSLDRNLSFALVSNLGVIEEFPQAPGMSVVDFQVLNTVDDTLFPGHYVWTYRGRLTVLYVLTSRFFSQDEADRLASEITEQLLIAGASS